jgi:hypothetical protein
MKTHTRILNAFGFVATRNSLLRLLDGERAILGDVVVVLDVKDHHGADMPIALGEELLGLVGDSFKNFGVADEEHETRDHTDVLTRGGKEANVKAKLGAIGKSDACLILTLDV